jgi:hypothetical protein
LEKSMTISPDDRSISQLLSDSLSELAKLIQNEVDLARAEVAEKLTLVGGAAKLIVAGSLLLLPALVTLLIAAALGLVHLGLAPPLAYLIVGLLAAAVAGSLVWTGIGRLSANALKPTETLGEIRRDRATAKELIR